MRSKLRIYHHNFRDLIDIARELHFRLLQEVAETGDFSLWRSPRRLGCELRVVVVVTSCVLLSMILDRCL